jgi:EmrB/QacA subfamily drug resistance transporter
MRPWWPLVAICLGTFMLLVDVTIVNVALPSIATSLGSTFTDLQWVIDGYALALAALLLLTGSLADRFGRRRLYLAGLGVFSVASLGCGLAGSAGLLVAARVVQGAGAAAMFATTAALVAATYSGRRRGVAFGIWGAVNGLAAASGPLLGGVLTESLGWPAIFLVNLPVAAVAVVLTLAVVPESTNPRAGAIDVPGAVTFTLAVAALVYALIAGGDRGWDSEVTLGALGLGAVALVAFVVVERRAVAPMLDLALFRRPSFVALMVAALLAQGAAFAHLAYVSIWLQSVLGLTPIKAGLAVLPLSVASFVVAAAGGRFLHGLPPRLPIGAGLAFVGVGVLLLTIVGPTSGPGALMAGLVVLGIGVGLSTPVLVSAAIDAVPGPLAGTASAAVNTFRQLGLAVGIAGLGTLFADRLSAVVLSAGGSPQLADALPAGQAGRVLATAPPASRGNLDALVHTAFAAGLDRIFTVAGIAALVAAVLVVALVRPHRAAETQPVTAGAAS